MSEDARKYASELRDIAGMVAQTEDGPLRWKQYRLAAIADYLSAYQSEAPAQGEGLLQAAINQNDAMRQELAHVGNLVSDLARAMGVDQANADGSWPDLAGRILRLQDAALATPAPILPLADREAIARVVDPSLWARRDFDAGRRDYYEAFVKVGWSGMPFEEWVERGTQGSLAKADAILALSGSLPPSPVGEGRETWASIAEWCEATFGPCTPYRIVSRAAEEMKELAEETLIDFDWSDKAREEVADVLICLSRVPGIWEAVEDKMTINRAREWRIMGDGTGYHVRAGNEPPTPAPVRGE